MRPLGKLLLPFLCLLLAPACGQEDEGEEEALRDRVVRVAAQVAEIRGLTFGKLPKVEIRPRAALRPVLVKALRKERGLQRFARLLEVQRRLGLFPGASNDDPIESWLDASVMAMGAYYNHETDTVLLVEEGLPEDLDLDVLLAHELTHALQARHRDPSSLFEFTHRTNDAAAWRLALVEGEATLVQLECSLRALQILASEDGELRADALPPELANRIAILDTLTGGETATLMKFAYYDGARLLDTVEAEGGWEAVESLFASPDLTTEIVLHPEKLKDPVDHPTTVVLGDLGDLLTGWTRILADTLGEAEIRSIFDAALPEATAAAASIGWDGDRLLAYEEVGGKRSGLIWALVFDSELDAQQFKEAWIQLGGQRSELRGVDTISGRKLCVVCGFTKELRDKILSRAGTFTVERHQDDDLGAAAATSRAAEEKAVAAARERRGDRVDGVLTLESGATGMRLSVPEDWDRRGTEEEPTLFHRKSAAKLSLYSVDEETEKAFMPKFRARLAAAGTVRELERGRIDLAGREGHWRAYEVVGAGEALRIGVRLYACPAEDGKRFLVLVYPFEEQRQALEAVLPILESLALIKQEPRASVLPGGR